MEVVSSDLEEIENWWEDKETRPAAVSNDSASERSRNYRINKSEHTRIIEIMDLETSDVINFFVLVFPYTCCRGQYFNFLNFCTWKASIE